LLIRAQAILPEILFGLIPPQQRPILVLAQTLCLKRELQTGLPLNRALLAHLLWLTLLGAQTFLGSLKTWQIPLMLGLTHMQISTAQ
jgi:hypothetical protein